MSTQYTTEPPPTATVLVHTTAGPLTISLFAQQTPLTCRNFLQHCLDGTYNNVIFHRVAPNFVIQTGDPTGTGEGGTNIYEDGDKNLERYGEQWGRLLRLPEERWNEKITLGDEKHTRLKFNRRGLVGMARMNEERGDGVQGQYGTQWFITLGDARNELDGRCTMFGRVEGDGIYNIMKIANGELVEGTERPVYPERITSVEIVEMPSGEVWKALHKRERVAVRTTEDDRRSKKKDKSTKKKGGKTLLSFGGDGDGEDDGGIAIKPKKAKFNTALIDGPVEIAAPSVRDKPELDAVTNTKKRKSPDPAPAPASKPRSPEPQPKRRKPSFHEPTTQFPIRDPESPSRSRSATPEQPSQSPPPSKHRPSSSNNHKSAATLQAEITALKATMKRDTAPTTNATKIHLSALEKLIPTTSTRGRKRPRPGAGSGSWATDSMSSSSMKLLNAFRVRLDSADQKTRSETKTADRDTDIKPVNGESNAHEVDIDPASKPDAVDEEAALCDLHFIANCQSCSDWVDPDINDANEKDGDQSFLGHALTFEKDRLGKDLTWKRKNEEELVVIDPREKERDLGIKEKGRKKGGREWDRDRDKDAGRIRENTKMNA